MLYSIALSFCSSSLGNRILRSELPQDLAKRIRKVVVRQRPHGRVALVGDVSLLSPYTATTFRIPRGTPGRVDGSLHHLRVGVASTRVPWRPEDCRPYAVCEVPETVNHLFFECLVYERERAGLRHTLSLLDNRPFLTMKVLGTWPTANMAVQSCKALLRFLRNTELASVVRTVIRLPRPH